MSNHLPIILIIGARAPWLEELEKKYSIIYHIPDRNTSPFIQAEKIIARLKSEKIQIEAVVGFLDYASVLAAIIAKRLDLPGPSPQAVYLAQNKKTFIDAIKPFHTFFPETEIINITKDTPHLSYPLFIRPLKGSFSVFSYKVQAQEEYENIRKTIMSQHTRVEKLFEIFFRKFNKTYTPLQDWFIVQEFINYKQYTLDGYVKDNKVILLGLTESIYTQDRKSFKRFDFPVTFSPSLTKKLKRIVQRTVHALNFNTSFFNVEFFLTPNDQIILIELNTRVSPGFSHLYSQKYNTSLFEMAVELALGETPDITQREKQVFASSFPLRVSNDRIVRKVPTKAELEELKRKYDVLNIRINVQQGMKLSDLRQDAYTFRYGIIDIAGKDRYEIDKKFSHVLKDLPIVLEEIYL